jgi:sec-independent protein translocase protein TatA
MGAIGTGELVVILVVVLLLFGGSRLPTLARAVGEAVRELRHATDDEQPAAREHRERPPTRPDTGGQS